MTNKKTHTICAMTNKQHASLHVKVRRKSVLWRWRTIDTKPVIRSGHTHPHTRGHQRTVTPQPAPSAQPSERTAPGPRIPGQHQEPRQRSHLSHLRPRLRGVGPQKRGTRHRLHAVHAARIDEHAAFAGYAWPHRAARYADRRLDAFGKHTAVAPRFLDPCTAI